MMEAVEEPRGPSPTSVMENGEVRIGSSGIRKQRRRKKVGVAAPVLADLKDVNGKGLRRRRKSMKESKTLMYGIGVVCVVLTLWLLFCSSTHKGNLRAQEIERLRKTVEYMKEQNRVGKDRKEWKYSPDEHEAFLKDAAKSADKYVAEEPEPGFFSFFGSRREKRRTPKRYTVEQLDDMLEELDEKIMTNQLGLTRWTAPHLMIPIEGDGDVAMAHERHADDLDRREQQRFFKARRKNFDEMAWYEEYETLESEGKLGEVPIDYAHYQYDYPEIQMELPKPGSYPPMETLGDVMRKWPQDQDFDGPIIKENLFHFNFSDPDEFEAAKLFRNAELPFKLYDIPELKAATELWTDEYVSHNFDQTFQGMVEGAIKGRDEPPKADGQCQESQSNFFAFFTKPHWDIEKLGLPPTRDNNWSFQTWSKHARYADAVALDPNRPHFYWQSGVPKEERHMKYSDWTFISRDLPFLSSPTENFFVFHPNDQKGIQCRFGERGVVAATHYDSGRNMVAMVTGAKRYILSPPRECYKLEISTNRKNPIYRHSLLNFGHINNLDSDEGMTEDNHMSDEERAWLQIAATADAIDTVLKAGEVLYIPSHWFHYIVSVQKSAQCNVRSGVDEEGSLEFGGREEVRKCKKPSLAQSLWN